MVRAVILMVAVVFGFSLQAQIQYENVFSFGGTSYEFSYAADNAPGKGTYVVGQYNGNTDFDPGVGVSALPYLGSADGYVARYKEDASLVWAFNLSSSAHDAVNAVATNENWQAIVGGHFSGVVDFDPGAGTYNLTPAGQNAFVAAYDSVATLLWVQSLPASGGSSVISVTVDKRGGYIVIGDYSGTMDLDPGVGTNMVTAVGSDHFVIFLDAQGNYTNGFSQGSPIYDNDELYVTQDANKNYYFAASYADSVDVDPTIGTSYLYGTGAPGSELRDFYVVSYDTLFNIRWSYTFGEGPNHDFCRGLEYVNGRVVTGGYYWGSFDADPGPSQSMLVPAGMYDIFLLELDTLGIYTQSASVGGTGNEVCRSFGLSPSGNLGLTGFFSNSTDADPGPGVYTITNGAGSSLFLGMYDQDFGFLDAYHIRGVNGGTQNCPSTYFLNENEIRLVGSNDNTIDFLDDGGDIIPTFSGGNDVFVVTYVYCSAVPSDVFLEVCEGDSAYFMGNWHNTAGVYSDTLIGMYGCDSLVNYNLAVNPLPVVYFGTIDAFFCVYNSSVSLNGQPAGGTFSGAGISANTFDPAVAGAGVHTLVYSYADANACAVSDSVTVTVEECLGLNEFGDLAEVLIYPNPSANWVQIENRSGQDVKIEVRDLTGKTISTAQVDAGETFSLDFSDRANGTYFIELSNQEVNAVKKLVVQQ